MRSTSKWLAPITALAVVATIAAVAVGQSGGSDGQPSADVAPDGHCDAEEAQLASAGLDPAEFVGDAACPAADEIEALIGFCQPDSCTVLDPDADRRSEPMTIGEALQDAVAISECPTAAAELAAKDVTAVASIGRCPTVDEARGLANTLASPPSLPPPAPKPE